MAYTNSPLVSYTRLTNNYWAGRKYPLTRITPHCVVGQCSVETLGNVFYPASRQASCQYGIGSDGRIGMYVEEKNSSWCSSSYDNDNRAVTIEVASDTTHPYAMKDTAYQSLIKLCADICKRNGKKKLLWLGNKEKALAYKPKDDEMVLTAHRFFKNKACPGDWLYSRFGELADKVNALLNASSTSNNKTSTTQSSAPVATNASDNETKIWNFLKGKGLNDYAVAGVMGNLYAESALNPKNLQNSYEKKLGYTDATYTTAVDNGRYTNFVKDSAGYGLAQWTYWSRKQNLYNYAKKTGKSIGDLSMQLDFLWSELNGYSKVMAQLKSAKSVLAASNAMLLGFEKPADQSTSVQSRRAGYGQTYYNKYAGKKVEAVTTAPSAPKAETPKQTTTSTETKVSSTIYRVQIGAFGVKANADKQLAKVKAAGFTNAILAYDGKLYRVQVGAYAVQQNAINMCFKVKKAGFTDAFVSSAGGINTKVPQKTVDQVAKEVIQGKWGNGAARKKALEAAGYNYNAVQAKVSALMSK